MKLFFSLMLALPLLLGASNSTSTNKIGNGGNIVACKEKGIEKYQLLDFYESNLNVKDDKPYIDLALDALTKIERASEKLGKQYKKRLATIEKDFDLKANVELVAVGDSLHAFVPKSKNCRVVQAIIRKQNASGDKLPFLVNKEVWNKLGSSSKAGLIVHEIIYEHLSQLGQTDSRSAREINALIFGSNFNTKTFWDLLASKGIPIYP